MISRNERYLYWLMGVGCGILLTGAFMTYVGLSVQDELISTTLPIQTNVEQSDTNPSTESLTTKEEVEIKAETQTIQSNTENQSNQVQENEQLMDSSIEESTAFDTSENDDLRDEIKNQEGSSVSISIPSNATATGISNILEEAGVVDSAQDFRAYIGEQDKVTLLRTGNMLFVTGDSYENILNTLLGKTQ